MTRKSERKRRFLIGLSCALCAVGVLSAVALGALSPIWLLGVVALLVAMHRAMIAKPGIAVLTYHSVSPDPAWLPWSRETSVHPDTFRAHCETLQAMGLRMIGSREFVDLREAGEPRRRDLAVIHLDDGYRDNWQFAVPELRERSLPATFFVSLDFIEPGDDIRDDSDLSGYMNWPELSAVEAIKGLEVEPHGVDHARVPVSDRAIDVLTPANWRRHAWLQWHRTEGPKHDWFRHEHPPSAQLGELVPESDLALAAPAWRDGGRESEREFAARVSEQLSLCQTVLAERLGHVPTIFCWPENKTSARSREIAAQLGYRATTGGKGRNTASERADIISRIHMGDRALGFRWLPAERLHVRAATRLAQGNLYWFALVAPMNAMRKLMFAWRARFGRAFA